MVIILSLMNSCKENDISQFAGQPDEVELITLAPGHFHAYLVQKEMYDQVHSTVHVYAPEGP